MKTFLALIAAAVVCGCHSTQPAPPQPAPPPVVVPGGNPLLDLPVGVFRNNNKTN